MNPVTKDPRMIVASAAGRILARFTIVMAAATAGWAGCSADSDGTVDSGIAQSAAGAGAGGSAGGVAPASGAGGQASIDAGGGAGASSSAGTSGSASIAGTSGSAAGASGSNAIDAGALEPFSFFVTSWAAMQRLSGTADGFGGDLRYGEADGLAGADKICTEIAETSMPGSGAKQWRAFLSITGGPGGTPVHAIDRVGQGPWYDRLGRLVAMTKQDLLTTRPTGADPAIVDDLPNEDGVPNHAPDGMEVDNHDILTGTNDMGQVFSMDWASTCHDWTSAVGSDGRPRVGHSWPRSFGTGFGDGGFFGGGGPGGPGFPGGPGGFPFPDGGFQDFDGENWMSSLDEAGCAPGASLVEMGPPNPNNPTVGSGGGYGGIYCFALSP
jgi:hypothetical protein